MVRGGVLLALAVGTAACGGEDVPVGESGLASIVGSWTGYVENHEFSSGSDAVTTTFSAQGGALVGSIVFGEALTLAPPSDPEVGYPPELSDTIVEGVKFHQPYERFAYSIHETSLTGERLRFGVEPREIWNEWCVLQTPHAWNDSEHACLPSGHGVFIDQHFGCTFEPEGEPVAAIDCAKLRLCEKPDVACACDADGCGPLASDFMLRFDMVVSADRADGSVVGIGDGVLNVHLQRQ